MSPHLGPIIFTYPSLLPPNVCCFFIIEWSSRGARITPTRCCPVATMLLARFTVSPYLQFFYHFWYQIQANSATLLFWFSFSLQIRKYDLFLVWNLWYWMNGEWVYKFQFMLFSSCTVIHIYYFPAMMFTPRSCRHPTLMHPSLTTFSYMWDVSSVSWEL